jgi:hypothetical protein
MFSIVDRIALSNSRLKNIRTCQVLFLILLTQFYNSDFVAFIYNLLIGNFYILALFLILKDSLRYRLIKMPG